MIEDDCPRFEVQAQVFRSQGSSLWGGEELEEWVQVYFTVMCHMGYEPEVIDYEVVG